MSSKPEQRSTTRPSGQSLFTQRREPYQFMLYLGLGGSALVFLVFAALYTARKGEPGWIHFNLPGAFWISTGLILASSFTLHQANRLFRSDRFTAYKWWLSATFDLGLLFAFAQVAGWRAMLQNGIAMSKSTAGAFMYIISGLHLLHVAAALAFGGFMLVQALRRNTYVDGFVYSVNPPNQLRLRLLTHFWHFVDGLWALLFLFFLWHQHV